MIRAGDWWTYKVGVALGTAYLVAFGLGHSLLDAAPAFGLLLLALVPGAAYVSILGDLTDIELDRRAGKANRMAARSPRARAAWLGACLAAGALLAVLAWAHDPVVLGLYGAAWVAFALYSVEPVRLKRRGLAGPVADAVGAHVVPQLLAAVLVFRAVGEPLAAKWLVPVGIWALALGLRSALWHQEADRAADERAGLVTFARAHPRATQHLAAWLLLPAEAAALGVLLLLAADPLAWILLGAHGAMELLRMRRWHTRPVIVRPVPRGNIVLQEYEAVLLPVAAAGGSALRHPADALVLLAQVILFWPVLRITAREAYLLLGRGLALRILALR